MSEGLGCTAGQQEPSMVAQRLFLLHWPWRAEAGAAVMVTVPPPALALNEATVVPAAAGSKN